MFTFWSIVFVGTLLEPVLLALAAAVGIVSRSWVTVWVGGSAAGAIAYVLRSSHQSIALMVVYVLASLLVSALVFGVKMMLTEDDNGP